MPSPDPLAEDEVRIIHPGLGLSPNPVKRTSLQTWLNEGWSEYVPEAAPSLPAGNASTDEWRTYAAQVGLADPGDYSRDELRDLYTTTDALSSDEE